MLQKAPKIYKEVFYRKTRGAKYAETYRKAPLCINLHRNIKTIINTTRGQRHFGKDIYRNVCHTALLTNAANRYIMQLLQVDFATDKKTMKLKRKIKFTVWQLLALGYLAIILLGSILLVLPFSAKNGHTSYHDALFVSVSATCVTGLVPFDTGTHFSAFGQVVILLLIQTGGLGFMTFVSVAVSMFGKKMGLYGRKALMLSAGENNLNSLKYLIRRILIGTLIFETAGAALLSVRFIQDFGAGRGIWYAVFHSVSAFCNAGFDVLGSQFGQYASLTHYAGDPLVVLTISFLIIMGGLGFVVWSDVIDTKFRWRKFRLHTKIVLLVNTVLLVLSTLLFLLFERNSAQCQNFSWGEKLLTAFFNATTTRTAGFNTVDMGGLSDSGKALAIMLMFVGGSSGSTAGGIKINTCAVIIMGMWAAFRGRKDVNIGRKRIDPAQISQALAVFVSCMFLVLIATLTICTIESDTTAPFLAVLFETVSALGTVGLSMSLTPTLGIASKIILMLLMYAGRVGILTIALAFAERKDLSDVKCPVDDTVLIG